MLHRQYSSNTFLVIVIVNDSRQVLLAPVNHTRLLANLNVEFLASNLYCAGIVTVGLHDALGLPIVFIVTVTNSPTLAVIVTLLIIDNAKDTLHLLGSVYHSVNDGCWFDSCTVNVWSYAPVVATSLDTDHNNHNSMKPKLFVSMFAVISPSDRLLTTCDALVSAITHRADSSCIVSSLSCAVKSVKAIHIAVVTGVPLVVSLAIQIVALLPIYFDIICLNNNKLATIYVYT